MNTKDVILELRTKKGLSQDELAEKVYVTRQVRRGSSSASAAACRSKTGT